METKDMLVLFHVLTRARVPQVVCGLQYGWFAGCVDICCGAAVVGGRPDDLHVDA
jgi:hypothetical protein